VKKLSHEDVKYRVTVSVKRRCGTCVMYVDKMPPDCTLVEKPIRPGGVCDRWERGKERRSQGG
jgi:hypothetical protein